MKCVICKQGETQPGTTTVTLERGTTTVVFKNVPAEVCETCGEAYLDAAPTRHLLHIVEEAAWVGCRLMCVRMLLLSSIEMVHIIGT